MTADKRTVTTPACFDAIAVTSCTLVGILQNERPNEQGNCFNVVTADERHFNILNFNYENLQALIKLGLTWPLRCKSLDGMAAVVMDGRIGERWYDRRYCEVCCPLDLLPITQLQQHERDIARGRREEHGSSYTIHLDQRGVEFP